MLAPTDMNLRLEQLLRRAPSLSVCVPSLEATFATLRDSLRAGGKILLCGNGGSASDAEHWAGELLKGFLHKRPLTGEKRERLGDELAGHLQAALPAIPLSGFTALRSAFANDCEDAYGYAQLVLGLGRPGDVLVGISTSGNAANVCHAIQAAKALGLHTIGLTGGAGGKLAGLVETTIAVPETEVYLIQELHLPVYHCLSLMLEDEFFGEK